MQITDKHVHILRHSLGLTQPNKGYRNHFCTGPGSKDFEHCEQLVAAGFMFRREPSELSGGDYIYHVTEKGKEVARVY